MITSCGFERAGVLGILGVVVHSGEQYRHQRMDSVLDFALIGAELAGDISRRNL